MILYREGEYVKNHFSEMILIIKDLCATLEALPGVRVAQVGETNPEKQLLMWIQVYTKKGAMFLGRIFDCRYTSGALDWRLVVDNSDSNEDYMLLRLESINPIGENTVEKIQPLIDSMNWHAHNKAYIDMFMGDLTGFSFI